MSARKSSSPKALLIACAGLLPMIALGACADYVKHSDTITASAGDAITHNKVVHIADPWPRASANTHITGHGPRVDAVTTRYLSGGEASAPASLSIELPPPNLASPGGSPQAQ